jgi:hypothetical protein
MYKITDHFSDFCKNIWKRMANFFSLLFLIGERGKRGCPIDPAGRSHLSKHPAGGVDILRLVQEQQTGTGAKCCGHDAPF